MRNTELSKQLKELRTSKGLSQEELSDKSGLSLRTIQRIENAESYPRGDTLRMLTNALEIPEDYFTMSILNNTSDVKQHKIIMPWYIIGFTIMGGAIGFILGVVLLLNDVIPRDEIGSSLVIGVTVFFVSIGLIVGNLLEKKQRVNEE